MRSLARDIASGSSAGPSGRAPWMVDQLTRTVFVRTFTGGLPPAEAVTMRATCAERLPKTALPGLSATGRVVHPLLTALPPDEAAAAVDALPDELLATMDAMSPLADAARIRVPLVSIAHDRDDAVIPIGESRRLAEALRAAGQPVRYTEFRMFKHLDPTQVRLSPVALARELLAFYRMLLPIFRRPAGT
jgi:pimeloyl-ACP methyl ester carboxylesterase